MTDPYRVRCSDCGAHYDTVYKPISTSPALCDSCYSADRIEDVDHEGGR